MREMLGSSPSSLSGGACPWSDFTRIAFCFCREPDLVLIRQICPAVLVPEVQYFDFVEDVAPRCPDAFDQSVLVQPSDLSDRTVESVGEFCRGVPFHDSLLIVLVVNILRHLKSDPIDRDA